MAQEHFDHLDGWRGLAICTLLLGHFFPVPGINFGAIGVNLFFVLSGVLMSRLLFVQHTPIPLFYKRRVSRIVPAHVVFVLAIAAYFWASALDINWRETLAALFFVNNYVQPELGNAVMPLGHIWSLSVEEHSYVLLSLVALAARRGWVSATAAVGLLALGCVAAGLAYALHYSGRELEFGLWLHTEVAAYGIMVSSFIYLLCAQRRIPTLPVLVYPAVLLAGVLAHWWSVPLPIKTFVGVGLFALSVNLLFTAPALVKRVLSFTPLRLMGLWSFSIYLWQQPFYLAAHRLGWPKPVALLAAITAGLISFYALEQPVRRYLNRVWGKAAAA